MPRRGRRGAGQVCAAGRSEHHHKKRIERAEISNSLRFDRELYSRLDAWLVRPVHSNGFTPRLVYFYAPCYVATCLFDPARLFTLSGHVGPDAALAPVVRVCFLGRPVRPDDRPMRPSRRGPSHWHVGPVLLEVGCRGLPGPRSVRPLCPSGVAGSRARPKAPTEPPPPPPPPPSAAENAVIGCSPLRPRPVLRRDLSRGSPPLLSRRLATVLHPFGLPSREQEYHRRRRRRR